MSEIISMPGGDISLIGGFDIDKWLFSGGMDTVCRARYAEDNVVAFKALHQYLSFYEEVARCFHIEAKVATKLSLRE